MINTRSVPAAIVLVSSLLGGAAQAASVGGDIVYEKVDMFSNSVHFTDSFSVGTQGTYKATLTDFEFPNPFAESGLNVTTATASLGKLSGPGSFMFDADPGEYYVSMFASVAPISDEQKKDMIKADLKTRRLEKEALLTEEEKQEKRDIWQSLSKEEKRARKDRSWRRAELRLEQQLAEAGNSFGQYGIEIALMQMDGGYMGGGHGSSVVPLPGALWLFGTGLVALLGLGRSSSKHA